MRGRRLRRQCPGDPPPRGGGGEPCEAWWRGRLQAPSLCLHNVIPAPAGIQTTLSDSREPGLDSRRRGNDTVSVQRCRPTHCCHPCESRDPTRHSANLSVRSPSPSSGGGDRGGGPLDPGAELPPTLDPSPQDGVRETTATLKFHPAQPKSFNPANPLHESAKNLSPYPPTPLILSPSHCRERDHDE